MAKKTKRVVKSSGIKSTKREEDASSFLMKHPTWQFNRTDKIHEKWNVHNNCQLEELMDKLTSFERMTWSEIMVDAKKQHHHVYVETFIKEAQSRLSELRIYEDQLFSLRLTGATRVYGILRDGVFSIIWYDCNHEICPSVKKHT